MDSSQMARWAAESKPRPRVAVKSCIPGKAAMAASRVRPKLSIATLQPRPRWLAAASGVQQLTPWNGLAVAAGQVQRSVSGLDQSCLLGMPDSRAKVTAMKADIETTL